jgi:hypothetical protein
MLKVLKKTLCYDCKNKFVSVDQWEESSGINQIFYVIFVGKNYNIKKKINRKMMIIYFIMRIIRKIIKSQVWLNLFGPNGKDLKENYNLSWMLILQLRLKPK